MKLRSKFVQKRLPADAQVRSFTVREGLSRIFDIEVEVVTEEPNLDFSAMIDQPGVLELNEEETGQDPRRFHGLIEEAEWVTSLDLGLSVYRFRLRPKLHALAYETRSRLFQDSDVVTIVKEVLTKAGLKDKKDVVWRTERTYPKRDLCTQYRESNLAFVLRLLEDEGIFFWFTHTDDGHVLVLADQPDVHEPIEGESTLRFARTLRRDVDLVTELTFSSSLCPDTVFLNDWNWERPDQVLEATFKRDGAKGRAWTEYPGGFLNGGDGTRKASDRLDAMDVERVLTGLSSCRRLLPGTLFDVANARPDLFCRDWLLVNLEHRYEWIGHTTREQADGNYRVRFQALAGDANFRPQQTTARPKVFGNEIGTVVGPGSEEIHVDKYGRVKVHFYWDRERAADDKASCWIRVQQLNTAGHVVLPRVGYEVSVGFVDGDPDRPVVLQKLYNRKTMPPHGLPDAKSKGLIQSRTTNGGGGFNAFGIEDAGGGMCLDVTASRNLTTNVGNDMCIDVGHALKETIGNSFDLAVNGNDTITIKQDQKITVDKNALLEVGKEKDVTVGGTDNWQVGGNRGLKCEGNRTDKLDATMAVTATGVNQAIDGKSDRSVTQMQVSAVARTLAEDVTGDKSETVFGARVEVLKKGKVEFVGKAKLLTGALIREKAGTDITHSAAGGILQASGGSITHTVTEEWCLTGKQISVIALTGATLKVGGQKLTLNPTKFKLKASKMGGKGLMQALKGKMNFKG